MANLVKDLIELLDLEAIEVNLFRGRSPQESWQRVFGGQVIGQALVAAHRTIEKRIAHSLHAYFIRPGDPKIPILYEVDRARDGRSFTTRRVVAIQHGRPIFNMSVSFQVPEEGLDHQIEMPDVPQPEDLISLHDHHAKFVDQFSSDSAKNYRRRRPIEIRPVSPRDPINPAKGEPKQYNWVRAIDKLPDDMAIQQCVLAYATDLTLLDTTVIPHGLSWAMDQVQSASLDHAIWFHRPFRADEWLLYAQDSPSAFGARGFTRGTLYKRDGTLVASVAQEGLVRVKS